MAQSGETARLRHPPEPRDLNVLLGAWLLVSAFLWPHGMDDWLTTGIVGALIAISGVGAFVAEELRYVETIVAGLLIVAALVLPHLSPITVWNNGIVGLAVIVLSFVHRGSGRRLLHRYAHR
jgi:hypothetical protein